MKFSFLGGAGEVTGSCTLVETADARLLFVVHGERDTAAGFRDEIKRQLGWTGVEAAVRGEVRAIA